MAWTSIGVIWWGPTQRDGCLALALGWGRSKSLASIGTLVVDSPQFELDGLIWDL